MKKHMRISTTIISCMLAVIAGLSLFAASHQDGDAPAVTRASSSDPKIVIAYVTSTATNIPDTSLMTHIAYGFADISEDLEHPQIRNIERFKKIAALCDSNPRLGLILSIGGAGAGGFSKMTRSKKHRRAFARNVKRLMDQYGIDWIDLDWEFPCLVREGIVSSPDDDKNYVRLVKDLRREIGPDKKISFYSNNGAIFIDFPAMMPYVDYVMASGYNLAAPPKHQSNLFSSKKCGDWSVDKSMRLHLQKGVPREKLLMGIPFYGRYKGPKFDGKQREVYTSLLSDWFPELTEHWDDEAQAPYLADPVGNLIVSYDNARSIARKCQYVDDNGLAGVFYWNSGSDFKDHKLAKTVKRRI